MTLLLLLSQGFKKDWACLGNPLGLPRHRGSAVSLMATIHPAPPPIMFALIETKGASHIAINIPHEGADKTIPALAGMLENNAVFIVKGYGILETRVPEMSIQLGDKIFLENSETELAIQVPASASVLDDSFVNEAPEVKVSSQKAIKRKDDEIARLRTELAHTKQQLTDLQERINAAAESEPCIGQP